MKNTPEGRLRGDLLLVSGEAEMLYEKMCEGKEIDLTVLKSWLKDLDESIKRYEEEK